MKCQIASLYYLHKLSAAMRVQTYICSWFAKELDMTIESGADVTRAKDRCLKRWGQSITEWSESWMQKEAHWELFER